MKLPRLRLFTVLPALLIFLIGCTVTLAPRYDQAIVDGLNEANEETLMLFNAVRRGSGSARYQAFQPRYDSVIGKFDAIRILASARTVPPLGISVVKRLGLSGGPGSPCPTPENCVNPTPAILQNLLGVLTDMEGLHRSGQMPEDEVAFSKLLYEEHIFQALSAELALKR